MMLLTVAGLIAAACGSGSSTADVDLSSGNSAPSTAAQEPRSDDREGTQSVVPTSEAPVASDTVAPSTDPPPDTSNYPQFTSVTSDGVAFDSLDYAGQDVLLWFWAPW